MQDQADETQVLIVEDDADISYVMWETLARAGIPAQQAYSGTEALLRFEQAQYDVVVLDLMLPGLDGKSVLKTIRESGKTVAILVVSARDEIESKVDLLQSGADDYLSKPFAVEEFLVRIQVLLRQVTQLKDHHMEDEERQPLSYGKLELNPELYEASCGDKTLNFTPQEYRILKILLSYPKQIFTKAQLYEAAWEQSYFDGDKTLNVHISNIRKKFAEQGLPELIETVWGIGYKLVDVEQFS